MLDQNGIEGESTGVALHKFLINVTEAKAWSHHRHEF